MDYKKIAIRFLKDTGLFPYWKKYLKYNPIKNPYDKPLPELVFGHTCFTRFISEMTNMYEPSIMVYQYFIWWLNNEGLLKHYPIDSWNYTFFLENKKNRMIYYDIENFYSKLLKK